MNDSYYLRFWLLLGLSVVAFAVGCATDPTTDPTVAAERIQMQATIDSLEKIVAELRDTPERRLLDAQDLQSKGRVDDAEVAYRTLVQRYPESEEAEEARTVLASIEAERKARREEEERRRRLQFLALPVERTVASGSIEAVVRGVSIRNRWTFDRYDRSWHYRDARRGNKYVVTELTISADEQTHNPSLPPVVVYRVSENVLKRLGVAEYRFYAWKDYGSYLGNYSDYSNDFAHSRQIRFTAGIQISNDEARGPLYVLLGDSGCVQRRNDRFGSPEVSYSETSCNPALTLTVDQAAEDFHVIQRLNAG